jgi:hypothetical protein
MVCARAEPCRGEAGRGWGTQAVAESRGSRPGAAFDTHATGPDTAAPRPMRAPAHAARRPEACRFVRAILKWLDST